MNYVQRHAYQPDEFKQQFGGEQNSEAKGKHAHYHTVNIELHASRNVLALCGFVKTLFTEQPMYKNVRSWLSYGMYSSK